VNIGKKKLKAGNKALTVYCYFLLGGKRSGK